MPTADHVLSEDGFWSLRYEGLDTSHDLGGENYLFQVSGPKGRASIRARVRDVTSSMARKKAKSEGIDYWSMEIGEARKCTEKFSEEFGKRFELILFEIVSAEDDHSVEGLENLLCQAILSLKSSYKFNNSDYPASGGGYYSDEIYFCPYGMDKRRYMTVHAEEGFDD